MLDVQLWSAAGVSAVVVLAAALLAQWVQRWFASLDDAARAKSAETLLENPLQVEKVPAPSLFGEATKSISFVIPAFNEEARLPATLDEAIRYLQRRRDRQGPAFTYEVVVVDDGSTDGTAATAFSYVRRHGFDAVRVVQLPRNLGKGAAVKAGMRVARGALLLMMDADGATRVSDVERLEAALPGKPGAGGASNGLAAAAGSSGSGGIAGAVVVVGSRAHMEAAAIAQRRWYRNLLMRGFHLLVVLVAGGAVRDTQCGFKLFTRPAARALFPNQRLQRWCFDVELVFLARRLGIPVAEVAVNWTEIPGSKVKVTSVAHMMLEMAAIAVGYELTGLWRVRMPAEDAAGDGRAALS